MLKAFNDIVETRLIGLMGFKTARSAMYYPRFLPLRYSHNSYRALCGLAVVIMLAVLFSVPTSNNLLPQLSLLKSTLQPQLIEMAKQDPNQTVSVIVQKTGKGSEVENAIRNMGGKITRDLSIINAVTVQTTTGSLAQLSSLPGVRWVSYDAPVNKSDLIGSTTGDYTANYLHDVAADQVWWGTKPNTTYKQGQNIGIAVVDSGINNFGGLNVVANSNFCSTCLDTTDQYGHGTHVAGIIAGKSVTINNVTYAGVAPRANLLNVRVSDAQGRATSSDVVAGLQYVLNNKAAYNIRIVNLSLNSCVTSSYQNDPLDAAVEILWFNGIVVVTSAGNNGNANLFAPANDPFAITVGSTDDNGTASVADDTVSSFSAYGQDETGNTKPDLVAPGRNLVSYIGTNNVTLALQHPNNIVGGGYFKMSGTSMAAPVVSGAVALLLQSEPNLNPDQVKNRLKASARQNAPRANWDGRVFWTGYNPVTAGAGYLDIYAAMALTSITDTANTGLPASQLLTTGSQPVLWGSVNWSSVNWSSVNWSSVNWSSVNWSSVNWSSDYWGKSNKGK